MKLILPILALGLCLLASVASAQTLSPQQIKDIVASPDRSAADRTNDQRRKPERMLEFIAVHPGSTALDLSAAGGYTTELLARAIGPSGKVLARAVRAIPTSRRPRPPHPKA